MSHALYLQKDLEETIGLLLDLKITENIIKCCGPFITKGPVFDASLRYKKLLNNNTGEKIVQNYQLEANASFTDSYNNLLMVKQAD